MKRNWCRKYVVRAVNHIGAKKSLRISVRDCFEIFLQHLLILLSTIEKYFPFRKR